MKLKKAKKGFTLVELVVVIAIIAILSTVSVVGYLGFTKKANVSGDKALVSQLNTILKADQATNGKAETPTEAIEAVKESGYLVEKLAAKTSKYKIVWNQKDNEFALLDEEEKAVAGKVSSNAYENWVFADSYNADKGYSVYLNSGYSGNSTLDITTGLDVGENTNVDVVNYSKTTEAKDVTIRTNGGTLNIDADTDSVDHYGANDLVNIKAIDTASYHENGVVAYVRIEAGHFVAENTSKVINLNVATSNVTVTEESSATVMAYSKGADDVVVTVNGEAKEVTEVKSEEEIKTGANDSALVTDGGVVEVNGLMFKSLQSAINMAQDGDTLKLVDNEKVDKSISVGKSITIDFNGYVVENIVDIWGDVSNSLLSVKGGNVVLKDSTGNNGGLRAKQDDCYGIDIKNGASLTIESGKYIGNISVVQITEGKLIVTGGSFDLLQLWNQVGNGYDYTLNCIDSSYKGGTAKVFVQGGTFSGFDPSNNYAEGKDTSFLVEGYKVESVPHSSNPNINIYTVVKA